jgi:hypothetical protein
MKKIKSILLLVCSFFILVSCSSSSDSEDSGDPSADLIIGNWKLIGYNDASGAFVSGNPCIKVFFRYDANAAFTITADRCGELGGASGTWAKTSVANQYKFTESDGTVDYAIYTFTDNNTKFSQPVFDGVANVFQKQ